MADRLAHEIGNAMVPLATHQQLLGERFRDAEFRASLDAALAEGVKRVTRLVNRCVIWPETVCSPKIFSPWPARRGGLPGSPQASADQIRPVEVSRGQETDPGERGPGGLETCLRGDPPHALQANTANASVGRNPPGSKQRKRTSLGSDRCSGQRPRVHRRGSQAGACAVLHDPDGGLGLGLSVSQRIIQMHRGKLEILGPQHDNPAWSASFSLLPSPFLPRQSGPAERLSSGSSRHRSAIIHFLIFLLVCRGILDSMAAEHACSLGVRIRMVGMALRSAKSIAMTCFQEERAGIRLGLRPVMLVVWFPPQLSGSGVL